jgi:acyl carrier protein
MEKNEVLFEIQEIFRDVLDNEEIELTPESKADDIEEWDSLSNVQIVVAVEHRFGIRFTSAEIPSWRNVGDMIDSIRKKL